MGCKEKTFIGLNTCFSVNNVMQLRKFWFGIFVVLICVLTNGVWASRPPTPRNLAAFDVKVSSVKLSWNNGRMDRKRIKSFSIYYKVKEEVGGFIELTNINHPQKFIQRLQPGTLYIFKIVAVGHDGTESLRSIPVEVRTLEIAPGTPPRNVRARAVSTTTVIMEWQPPEEPNGIIQGYRIFYTLKPDLPVILWERKDVLSDVQAATIENLRPNVTYHMCILAYSKKGEGPVSNLIQVMTRQGGAKVNDHFHPDYVPSIFPCNSNVANENSHKPKSTKKSTDKMDRYQRVTNRRENAGKVQGASQARKRLNLSQSDETAETSVSYGSTPTKEDDGSEMRSPLKEVHVQSPSYESSVSPTQQSEKIETPMQKPLEESEREMLYTEVNNLRQERDEALQRITLLDKLISANSLSSGSVEGNDDTCKNMIGISWDGF